MKIGFIGLGLMGKPMSLNVLKAGYELMVLDLFQPAMAELVAAGAEAASTPKALAQQCEIIITMLPQEIQVKQVLVGPQGVMQGARKGSVVIDMSSITPLATRELAGILAGCGIAMLDAPVSGGQAKALDGTLSVMVGGCPAVFERCLPVLQSMAASVVRIGDIGAGNVAKLVNQVIVALNIAAMGEAMVLATKAGVDPELVFQALRGGLAGSSVMELKAPQVLDRDFTPGFRINLHAKDLVNVLETSHQLEVAMPLTAAVLEMMQVLKLDGLGDEDHCSLVKYFEKMAKVEVTRKGQ